MSLDWQVQLARLTLFLGKPYSISDKDWTVVTGQDEAETRQAISGGKRLSGNVPNGTLHMASVGSRFDVVLTAAEVGEDEKPTLPSVGRLDETFDTFFATTCKWLEEVNPAVLRVAFGAVVTCATASRDEAYAQLKGLLKSVKVDPAKMRDFQYRVNWPRTSGVEQGLLINRLTTWSALRVVRKLVQIDETAVISADKGEELHAVRLEVDHNTDDAKKAPFDQAKLAPIYSELIGLARENASKGEVS